MAVVLNSDQAAFVLSQFPQITPDMLGTKGLYVRAGNIFYDFYSIAGGQIGVMDVTSQAGDLGIADMADGTVQSVQNVTGSIVPGTSILDIIAQIPSNIVYDPSVLADGAKGAADAVSSFAQAAGADIGKVSTGLFSGLSEIKIFGVSLPVIAGIAVAGYFGFLLLPVLRRA